MCARHFGQTKNFSSFFMANTSCFGSPVQSNLMQEVICFINKSQLLVYIKNLLHLPFSIISSLIDSNIGYTTSGRV
jgi:hypothetical protein